ncbi:MAG: N-acetylmuramoyl-L-alanine amidase [Paraclostridium sp.]
MIIGNNAGHTISGNGSGAVGLLNESVCTRQISKYFVELAKKNNHKVINCTIDKSNNYLYESVTKANKQELDLAVSHHLNSSSNNDANGVEVFIYDLDDKFTYDIAARICEELSKLGLRNRGVKESKEFYWIRNTNSKAILIEYLFCSNKDDVAKYNPQLLAQTVYNTIIGNKLSDNNNSNSPYRYENGDYNKSAKIVNLNGSNLNIRAARNTSSKVIGKLQEGSIVKVDYCLDNWFSVWENGKLGFIYGEYVKLM